jgi:histidinol-phosphate aminotransferase
MTTKYKPGIQTAGDGWLRLHRNENLFIEQDWSIAAASSLIEQASLSLYPDPDCTQLRLLLAEVYGAEASNIYVGNGSDEVLSSILAILRKTYNAFSILDVGYRVYPLLADRYAYQLEVLPGNTFSTGRAWTDQRSCLSVIDSPNAITGTRLDYETILALASTEGSFVIWDNCYGEFAGDTLPNPLPANIVFVRTFSKYFGLAGLRIGYCIADAAIIGEALERKDIYNVNAFAQVMALEALRRRNEFYSLSQKLLKARDNLVSQLQDVGFSIKESSANFVLATHPAFSAMFLQRQLAERKIAVRIYEGNLTSNYLRITVPAPDGLDRLMAALTSIIGASK